MVIIVGTHMDLLKTEQEAAELEKKVTQRYNDRKVYPQVVACVSVSCRSRFNNNVDKLRQLIYDVATHLAVNRRDGNKCECPCHMLTCLCHVIIM